MSVQGAVGPLVNKFEQVSSDYHQMSLARGWVCPGVGISPGVPLPCNLSYDACDVTYPYLPTEWQTDTCENITFQQLLLWAVINIIYYNKRQQTERIVSQRITEHLNNDVNYIEQ